MASDVEIARGFTARPITEIAAALGVADEDLLPYGRDIAKVRLSALDGERPAGPRKLILVSAITPTPAGEGKTTTTIGLGQAFTRLGESVCMALREPSLGPCMGVKGGACGGGYSQVMPMDRINLHFTGDFHAITAANNLLAAMVDNHIHFGNELGIDPRRVVWRRVMDMNDRTLRDIVTGLGGPTEGMPREGGFDITAASEVMAMLCLANDLDDLRARLDRTLVGYTFQKEPVLAGQLGVTGALLALLRDAMNPNLVQAFEGTPAFVHGGPFANIAHGCNSVIATRMAMHYAEWTITEAGFGADLGAEKFMDIKCRSAGLNPDAIVLVATIRALKMHGGKKKDELATPAPDAVAAGLPNLDKHVENVLFYGKPAVVVLNKFATDSDEEIEVVRARCTELGIEFAVSDHHSARRRGRSRSGQGGDEGRLRRAHPVQGGLRARRLGRGEDHQGGDDDLRRRRGVLHRPGAQPDPAHHRARLRRAADLHRQGARLAVRRPNQAGPPDRVRGHGAQRHRQRRRRLPGRADRRDLPHARPAAETDGPSASNCSRTARSPAWSRRPRRGGRVGSCPPCMSTVSSTRSRRWQPPLLCSGSCATGSA